MRSAREVELAALCALALLACGGDFEPGSKIISPRILALQADRPFARPGEDVALTLLDANPEQSPLQWAWGTCTLPPASTVDACLEALDAELAPFEPGADALQVSVPRDLLDELSEAQRPSASIGVVVVACPGELRAGRTAGVPVRCVDADGRALRIDDFEVGVKRIFVRSEDRNENPTIEGITWDGEPWGEDETPRARLCEEDSYVIDDCAEALRHRIHVRTTPSESGRDEFAADFAEQTIVQFYSTHGVFRDQVRIAADADNRWVAQPQDGRDDDMATLWFVARDDRGGVSWATRQVELVP